MNWVTDKKLYLYLTGFEVLDLKLWDDENGRQLEGKTR